jgi:uncharacterized protein
MKHQCGFWIVFMAFCAFPISASASTESVVAELGNAPSKEALIEKVNGQVKSSVEAVLAEYDTLLEREPYDVALRIQRCKFLAEYVSSFESGSFLEDLYGLSEECDSQLNEDFAEHPEVLLLNLESSYGEERERRGKEIVSTMLVEGWTHGQMGRLYAALAQAANLARRSREAQEHARVALSYDEAADVRLILAEAHLARGENHKIVELLTTPFDKYKHDDAWYLLEKMKLLSRAGAMDVATSLYEQLAKAEYYNHLEAARTLRSAQAVDLARLEIQKAAAAYTGTTEDEKQLFFLEFEHGTAGAALKAYNAWRDAGWKQDPIGMNRIALAARDISLPWKTRDLLALLLAVSVLMVVALTCGAPIVVVHYWGFVRRHRNAVSYPTGGWQLRHAWAALAAFGSMAIIGMYAAGPLDFDVNALYQLNTDLEPFQWSRYALLEALLTTAAMILVLKFGPQNESARPWSTSWTLLKALGIGAAIGIALRIPLMLTALSQPDALPQVSDGDLWQLLRHIRDEMGLITALWLVGLMAPVVEEFMFRRVLLDSFTSHLGFARANILQAALFAAIHMDASAFIPLFALGLLLAHLARRSGGLLAPMMVHALFNLIAGLILLR